VRRPTTDGSATTDGPATAVAVVIPARDEAHLIASCLRSVGLALQEVAVEEVLVVVVVDCSRDDTAAVASATLTSIGIIHRVLVADQGTAGGARAVGVRAALDVVVSAPERTWVLSTDADTVVPSDWVARYLAHAQRGAVAVAGVVSLRAGADADRVGAAWWADYGPTLAVDGTHPHVHAANMGVRADVLQAAGGMPAVGRAEDQVLWRRLRAAGVAPVADARLVVATSARLQARVPRGFAHALRELDGAGA
jgi:glycosyltransferase involved in cell wall biosynthesis